MSRQKIVTDGMAIASSQLTKFSEVTLMKNYEQGDIAYLNCTDWLFVTLSLQLRLSVITIDGRLACAII
jgi:hypothetical protein